MYSSLVQIITIQELQSRYPLRNVIVCNLFLCAREDHPFSVERWVRGMYSSLVQIITIQELQSRYPLRNVIVRCENKQIIVCRVCHKRNDS